MNTEITVYQAYDLFLTMQCRFSYMVCEDLWPADADHYWQKWKNSERNIILFMNRLDADNKLRMLNWAQNIEY